MQICKKYDILSFLADDMKTLVGQNIYMFYLRICQKSCFLIKLQVFTASGNLASSFPLSCEACQASCPSLRKIVAKQLYNGYLHISE